MVPSTTQLWVVVAAPVVAVLIGTIVLRSKSQLRRSLSSSSSTSSSSSSSSRSSLYVFRHASLDDAPSPGRKLIFIQRHGQTSKNLANPPIRKEVYAKIEAARQLNGGDGGGHRRRCCAVEGALAARRLVRRLPEPGGRGAGGGGGEGSGGGPRGARRSAEGRAGGDEPLPSGGADAADRMAECGGGVILGGGAGVGCAVGRAGQSLGDAVAAVRLPAARPPELSRWTHCWT